MKRLTRAPGAQGGDGPKDANGAYLKASPPPPSASGALSIDDMMQRGLAAIDRLMRVITSDISTGTPSRETVMNLKDAMSMLESLKRREEELMANLSDEALTEVVAKND